MKNILKVIIISLFFCVSIYSVSFSADKAENLYPINDESGGGYINKDGDIVLKQKYNFAGRFVGDYAIVQNKNLKYGIIDKQGNLIVKFDYEELNNLSENFVFYKENNKYGYIDIINNKKSKTRYDDIKIFKEGLAAVCIDEKWGFIDKDGKPVIEPKYYYVSNFSEGLAAISYSKHKTAGYIDKKGNVVISFKDNNLEPKEFKEGLVPVIKGKDEACSYIDKKGKVVIDKKKIFPIQSFCSGFSEGLAVIYIYNESNEIITGYMDKKGNLKYVISFLLPTDLLREEIGVFDNFSSDMARFTIDYKTGYINKNFELVIPPVYEFARDFEGDLAYVKHEEIEGYINKKGHWVWSKPREGM
ncbi:MAG: WG repeat-containing protein [Elusimicrobia bacterium]|nr:WG repeat-containing protein [Elusimicrobiota bacterium]